MLSTLTSVRHLTVSHNVLLRKLKEIWYFGKCMAMDQKAVCQGQQLIF